MVPPPFNLRRCEPGDEDAVYEVCLRTGDDGRDARDLFDDPQALGHIFVGPYLKLEPELAFVLEDPQGICGYLLGALDSKKYYAAYRSRWLPPLRSRYAEPTGDQAHWTRTQRIVYEYYHPHIWLPDPYESYPSHLHIDLLPRAQGRGLGRNMMKVLLDELAARGSAGVHLGVGAGNARAQAFYKKLGFRELARLADVLYLGRHLSQPGQPL
jgi:ribosomal protein S18 acetylase RimI-like enzyme